MSPQHRFDRQPLVRQDPDRVGQSKGSKSTPEAATKTADGPTSPGPGSLLWENKNVEQNEAT